MAVNRPQSQPLLASLRCHIRNFEKNPEEILENFNLLSGVSDKKKNSEIEKEELALDDVDMEDFDDIEVEDEAEEDEDDDEEEEEEKGDDGEERKGREEENGGVEDRFFKIDELEEYMEDDEAREYGLKKKTKKISRESKEEDDDTGEEDSDEGYEEEDDE